MTHNPSIVRSERHPTDFAEAERALECKRGINHSQHHMQLSLASNADWFVGRLGIERYRQLAADAASEQEQGD